MKKVVRLGTVKAYLPRMDYKVDISVYCEITFTDDGKLSICGVIGPKSDGDCIGSCGQIEMGLTAEEITPAPNWTTEKIQKFLDIWRKWHLNDLKAGTPRQEAWVEEHQHEYHRGMNHYQWALEGLTKAGLSPDNGYKYGSAWLKVEVPKEVIDWLFSLPNTDKTPAWV